MMRVGIIFILCGMFLSPAAGQQPSYSGAGGGAGVGSCTNQAVTAVNAGAPTCTTISSSYVDGSVAPTASPALTGNPTVPTQLTTDNSTRAASTAFVTTAITNAVAGVNPAVAVQAATTAAGDTSGLTYLNGVSGVGATLTGTNNTALTIDGFTFTTLGQRLLVKNDTVAPSGARNGVYYVTQVQALALPPILTRALDYDMPSDMNNTGVIPVINGTVNGTTLWVLSSQVNTIGTDPLTFTKFGSGATVESHTASASATLDFTSCMVGANNVRIDIAELIPSVDSVNINLLVSTNGGSTWDNTAAHYGQEDGYNVGGNSGQGGSTSQALINLTDTAGTGVKAIANTGFSGSLLFFNPGGSSFKQLVGVENYRRGFDSGMVTLHLSGFYLQTTAVNAFRLQPDSGNFTSGVVRCTPI